MRTYYVYILSCSDGSTYTGVTNNLERRLKEHQSGIHPTSYTFSRRPVELLYSESFQWILDAIAREKQIKNWSRKKKGSLIQGKTKSLIMESRNSAVKSLYRELDSITHGSTGSPWHLLGV